MAGARTITAEQPRSTAYYYADLEKLKRKNGFQTEEATTEQPNRDPNEQSDYVESTEVVDEGPVAEVPPLRDRRQGSEYGRSNTDRKLEETYSTAGTFPMPEPKEKEPLLAELEVVGRLPLTQLDSSSGVRRSRSWYLCCPNVGEEEMSRESSWRYSSLRPVTAPPIPGQNGLHLVATQSSGQEDVVTLRNERDALARALAAEKQKAASAARAHDARLAELHGVIAELVRRRAQDKCARAIPEEEVSDECESTTQPAGELDNDADRSRTDQNDTSSLSPSELPSPLPQDPAPTPTPQPPQSRILPTQTTPQPVASDVSLNCSERDSEICVSTARCCQYARGAQQPTDESDIPDGLLPPSPGRCESRQAKLAARVRLRRAADADSAHMSNDQMQMVPGEDDEDDLDGALLALEYPEGAGGVGGGVGEEALAAVAAAWRARCLRLQADCRVLDCALARALDTAHRLTCACAAQESSSVALCSALRAADRALETYDVLLALAETAPPTPPDHRHQHAAQERHAAELVARRLLARLEAPAPPGPLLSPGPWLSDQQDDDHLREESVRSEEEGCAEEGWSAELEARLRGHAARLKADTVALRCARTPPALFSYHDADEDSISRSVGSISMAEMEAAVVVQEALAGREARACERARRLHSLRPAPASGSGRSRRRRDRTRHWLDPHASETDL